MTDQPGLYTPAALNDPYPIYERLRSETPIAWDGFSWNCMRYADVQAVLRDHRFLAGDGLPPAEWLAATGFGPLFQARSKMMLFSNPPDHTRLRSLVSKAFTPRVVDGMRVRIQQIVDELLDQAQARGQIELIEALAYPLPVNVIADMLGIPLAQHDQFREWSRDIADFIGGTTEPEEHMLRRALKSVQEMSEYFLSLAAELRRNPREGLLSAMALAEDQGDRLSAEELAANAILLLVAGHETTTNLIGNGTLALLRHPEQLALLRNNPELDVSAVEELLRYDSPVQGTGRRASADTEIGGVQISTGQWVNVFIGSANRDPAQFHEPDRLDITRSENRHLSFSHGAHYCLGAPLARLEAQIAIATLLRRFPHLRLADAPIIWRNNFTLRGLAALYLEW